MSGKAKAKAYDQLTFIKGQENSTDLTKKLQEAVEKARAHEQWRMEYTALLERDEKMREEGRKEEKMNSICIFANYLSRTGMSDESVIETISASYNIPRETVEQYVKGRINPDRQE